MSTEGARPGALEERLGYTFASPQLLARALTHSSAVAPSRRTERSYQRLEFLGDRVLGLVIAAMLHREMPCANEGELSRALNALVRKESCATVARNLDLGAAMNLGDSEARSGGAEKGAILADVAEGVIGAIYLDGGLDPARDFVEAAFRPLMTKGHVRRRDAKTMLQEWAQGRGLEPPLYEESGRTGPDHAPRFTITVTLAGFKPATATGPSKKLAEHTAAQGFLVRENVWTFDE